MPLTPLRRSPRLSIAPPPPRLTCPWIGVIRKRNVISPVFAKWPRTRSHKAPRPRVRKDPWQQLYARQPANLVRTNPKEQPPDQEAGDKDMSALTVPRQP